MHRSWTVFDDYELSATQKLIYHCLCKHQGRNESCFPSHGTIAAECSVSKSTVKRALAVLKQKGYINVAPRRRPDGGKSSNLYMCAK